MNHLVFLDTHAGELEKILSGTKSMIVKAFNPARSAGPAVSPGDHLYFLKDKDECALRVNATVVRVLPFIDGLGEDLSHILKEMQPRLQLTEDRYNYWCAKKQVLVVEFGSAQKISVIYVAPDKITDRSEWIAFEEFSLITE